MKKMLVIQISLLLLVSGSLGGMLYYTDIYEEIQGGIVEVLCLSCIKLNPKTSTDFTFDTANGKPHSKFVLDYISEGPVFLHYSEDDCPGCDVMFPIIKQFLNVEPEKEKSHHKMTSFENQTVPYFYIYLDDDATSQEWLDSFYIYDKDHIQGLPMFTVITLGYAHSGKIEPYYSTLYGAFKENTQQRIDLLTELMQEAFELYYENLPGYIK